ncbi:hypothetical protein GOP47_0011664 [Adiantum capillus-veneris]|uniref:Uncharacterized protein n=1 Tax=Adiantum capillus-veneris TaxID=13818 RepID=A0A9D4UTP8_ADICA|nr:hypothetical protein GOP47_0011664 [Adiantum capillus-veneris]
MGTKDYERQFKCKSYGQELCTGLKSSNHSGVSSSADSYTPATIVGTSFPAEKVSLDGRYRLVNNHKPSLKSS